MKINEIEMVVFDMAGTTIDEQNIVYKSLHKAINKFGIDVSLELVLAIGAGKEKYQAIKDILSHLDNNDLDKTALIFEYFKEILDQEYLTASVFPIEGVEEVLEKLKKDGIKIVLNTGYSSEVANTLLEKLKWTEGNQYDALITASDVVIGRPSPEMIVKAMELFGIVDASKVLKAGDSVIDIEEGKNANCGLTIGVLSGAQTRSQLKEANPDYILDSLASLYSVIN
ncbi:phosphonatase-like hydrolase [Flavobacterium aquidurense]|uniref:HAD family hydrolase n=1 Tax=Flavobacterium frigidimaris TaxID=262320 RepID=A0ABX4BQ32_FLAFR|nr:phosphonatase-like hydrolase [Flavobacterium frigidimaris]OXA78418.1 HAD family hydrolase [Flavobacterium frigidimaris]SDZ62969.1 phosphonatase-like hydrolase [Flavobacterium aquidurense]